MTQRQLEGERLLLNERGVERAIMAFYHALDASDFEHLIHAVAPDGVWYRQGKELRSRDMVREAMNARAPGTRTRHLVTNLLIDSVTADKAEARFYMTVFRSDGDSGRPKPDKTEVPRVVALYKVRLRLDNGEWLFTEIKGETTFTS